ncbi:MAG: sulfatase-like hydrolase/transferase [Flavisolibacter sp.]|nr:sulfatase-like hydrolase/transferase [Flavisolibacter sp.]
MKMKSFNRKFFFFTSIGLLVLGTNRADAQKANVQKKPNIVFILADDLGHHAISINGLKYAKTPNIDAIGQGGVNFTQHYVSAPMCCASRAGILTGRYQQRFGSENHLLYPAGSAYNYDKDKQAGLNLLMLEKTDDLTAADVTYTQGIPKTETNIAELLKRNGYATAIIGKWHQGYYAGYRPHERGFDYSWGWYGGSSLYYTDSVKPGYTSFRDSLGQLHNYGGEGGKYQWRRDSLVTGIYKNGQLTDESDYTTYAIAREAVNFIDQNKDRPFFLYVPFGAIHTPLQALQKNWDKSDNIKNPQIRYVIAMLLSLDEAVGQITKKIKDDGLEDNTIIVFSGDNGATYNRFSLQFKNGKPVMGGPTTYDDQYENLNLPLKGGKMTHYEGGIRTPLLIKWPAKIKTGITYNSPISALDLYSTFAAAAGAPLPKEHQYDGVNLVDYVNGNKKGQPHPILYWRNGFVKTIRKGDYKLMINELDKTLYLYNLSNDPYEQHDLAPSLPAKVQELRKDFQDWEKGLVPPRWKSGGVNPVIVDGKVVSYQI